MNGSRRMPCVFSVTGCTPVLFISTRACHGTQRISAYASSKPTRSPLSSMTQASGMLLSRTFIAGNRHAKRFWLNATKYDFEELQEEDEDDEEDDSDDDINDDTDAPGYEIDVFVIDAFMEAMDSRTLSAARKHVS
jgi:hypothetical protein